MTVAIPNYPSLPIARVGQTSIARSAASISSGVSGCLKKWAAVSSALYFKRFGASSRHMRHNAQLVSTYHGPGAFSGCLLSLSAMLQSNFQNDSDFQPVREAFFEERFDRRLAFDFSVTGAIAKSTCRLKTSTRATKTDSLSPTLNRLRDRRPKSCRRAHSNR